MSLKPTRALTALGLLIALGGCATGSNPSDPYEGYNRKVYAFNSGFDRHVYRPVAEGYQKVTPQPARTGIRNFFDNLADMLSLANNIVMLRPVPAMSDFMRVSVNTVLGLGGLLDIATPMGLHKDQKGFGDTLAHYGWQNSAYFMVPFFPPSTIRDTLGLGVDYLTVPTRELFTTTYTDASAVMVNLVDQRARLLPLDPARDAALDEYTFTRDAWMAIRARQLGIAPPLGNGDDNEEIDINELVPANHSGAESEPQHAMPAAPVEPEEHMVHTAHAAHAAAAAAEAPEAGKEAVVTP